MNKLKGLVVILDGLGDRPNKALNDLTPLEYATTPTLDSLVLNNQCGLMDPFQPGIPVDTHTGVSILFGAHPMDAIDIRRGPVEAAGLDLDMQPGDLFFRSNFATIESSEKENADIKDRRAGRIAKDAEQLCRALQNIDLGDNYRASLYPATHHRCVLKISGGEVSYHVSNTDPGGKKQHLGMLRCHPLMDNTEAQITANLVNKFAAISRQVLAEHPINKQRVADNLLPANAVISRSPGKVKTYKNLLTKLDLSVAVVAAERTILGLANLFSFTPITDTTLTACKQTDLNKKLKLAAQALQSNDLVFMHIKATDTTAHDKDPVAKADIISAFDNELKSSNIDFDHTVIGICADHSTDSNSGEHTGDAVPILIHNPNNGRKDRENRFNETSCAYGSLGRITAHQFLTSVLDAMDKLQNLQPSDTEYFAS